MCGNKEALIVIVEQENPELERINYYEHGYNGGCFGLTRYITNFCKQSLLVKTNVLIAVGMAAIEICEFLATLQINTLIAENDY